ncbi:MAG: reverse transcriptase-like protein [Crocosphaera sp.]
MSTNPQKPIIARDTPIMLFAGEFEGDLLQGVAAAVLLIPNGRRYTVSQLVSVNHKDEAEYTALIIGLRKADQLGLKTLAIKGDSDLVFNQVNGLTPIREERLRQLYRVAIKSIRSFEKVSLEWISPEQNRPAKSAVKRCINDALGREKPHQSLLSPLALSQHPAILRLLERGEQVTEEDYRQLTIEEDEWTHKSLSELRALIPVEVRDTIALQWQGDEDNLAQMYRWHLRGLPPIMACRKVNLDQQSDQQAKTKLPWEEALNLPQPLFTDSNNISEPLVSLLSELSELNESQTSIDDHSLSLPQSELEGPILFESLIQADLQDDNSALSLASEVSPHQGSNLSFNKENMASGGDIRRDTLLSESSIIDILKVIEDLSPEEQMALAQELVKIPDMVNLILKAIADNVSKGNTQSQ